ncbi:MAG TPA: winged helix-turn-helix domain-containing protein [Pirellulales bacterium]|jgi:hypothetical protein|nr:winged helix-turn-helix domain-containing protein [Pirellulales bacterium]
MAMTMESCGVEQIGEAAGAVWRLLAEKGPLTAAKIVKELDAPRDLVMQAIGWLAREDKLTIDAESRSKLISLRSI